jgi:hypothetical protein
MNFSKDILTEKELYEYGLRDKPERCGIRTTVESFDKTLCKIAEIREYYLSII